jgi:hypothetical protein
MRCRDLNYADDGIKPSYWEIALGAASAAGQNLTLALAAQYGKDNISLRGRA